ncbi:MAG: Rieske (2Fe-2S) protein [Proteobacteria bacterium]|nr:Rieske (2Fe-2S) protein [Pseudomonadota bacterium]
MNSLSGREDVGTPRPLLGLERLSDGALAEVEATMNGDAESLVLYRDGDHVRAWLNVCPHAGRRLDWAPGQFLKSKDGLLVCAAHGASFELAGGECVAGPCRGETLRAVPVDVRDGAVWLSSPRATSSSGV